MNPLLELFDWIFTTKMGKFIFITIFGLVVILVVNTLFPMIQLGWPTVIGCSLSGLIFAAIDKSLTKWY